MFRLKRSISALAVALVASTAALTGCTPASTPDPTATYISDANTLNIVAGSEQRTILDEVVTPWCKTQNLTCNYKLMGSVDQARLLESGNDSTVPYDAFWFASSAFRQLGDTRNVLQDVQSTSITPVVYAGWKSEMDKLGLTSGNVTIEQILQAVESKKTSVWITNPTQSNSGATVYMGYLNYFAGNKPGQPLTATQLSSPSVQDGIKKFVQSFANTPPSTGTMMDDCLAHTDSCRTMFTYEDLAIQYNKQLVAAGKEPLYVVYPKGSLAISDAPLGFYPHGTNDAKRQNFQKLQNFLLSKPTQDTLMQYGRRPATSIGLTLDNAPQDTFNPKWGIQPNLREQPITFPAASVIEAALSNYQTSLRLPGDTVYCIDGSGSMADNGGWKGVTKAAGVLFDPAQAEHYLLQANPGDRTTVIIFTEGVKAGPWTVTGNNPSDLLGLKRNIEGQGPGGGTGIYRCIQKATELIGDQTNGRRQNIIVMTDGQDNVGGQNEALGAAVAHHVPVITIGFGSDADANTLKSIADRTGGSYIAAGSSVDGVANALRSATAYR